MTDPAITVVALLVTGYLLMAAEIFVIPGFGVAGIGGFICLGAGCYLAAERSLSRRIRRRRHLSSGNIEP